MKKILHRILPLVLAFTLFLPSIAVYAALGQNEVATWPAAPPTEGDGVLVMDAKTGTILYGKNADKAEYPASVTKLMTALLTLENTSLTDMVTFSREAIYSIDADSAHIAVMPGEQLSVEDCLYALLLQSANEVANGLAEHIGGSMEGFAQMMNDRAAQLGCVNTHFVTPSGLHNSEHYTCAYDMALIMRELIKNETFINICSASKHTIQPTNLQPECRYLFQKHKMMTDSEFHYEGTVCGKMGYTPEAMSTLVTYAKRGNMELIAVSLNSNNMHYADSIALFDYGFNNFTSYNMADASVANNAKDLLSSSKELFNSNAATLKLASDSWIILPNNAGLNDIDTQLTMDEDPETPAVATLQYSYEGLSLGTATLVLEKPDSQSFDFKEHETASAALSTPTANGRLFINIWSVIAVVLVVIFLIIAIPRYRRARRRRNAIIRTTNSSKRYKQQQKRKKNRRSSDTFERRY